jgi:hypothetical protein
MSKGSIRSRMPTVAAIFDEVRAQFPEAKLLYGQENGSEIDAREPVDASQVFDIPENYCRPAGGWKGRP